MKPKWGEITAGAIASALGAECRGVSGVPVKGLSTDTRKIGPGDLFWPLKGENFDGHDFVPQAAEKGALGAVLQRGAGGGLKDMNNFFIITVTDTLEALGDFAGWWRKNHRVNVAAITGSVGKTTTKDMTAGILELSTKTLKNEGNLNNLIGLPITLLSLREDQERAVLEMGMNRFGEIARLTQIASPDVGLITNVARAHLEGVGDLRGVARAKTELMEQISERSTVLLNGDDDILMKEAALYSRPVITFGLRAKNHIRAEEITPLGKEGVSFEIHHEDRKIPIQIRVPGISNVFNALAAYAISIFMNESPENIREGLYRFQGVKGRFSLVPLPGRALLIDDTYNANPASLRAALATLKEWPSNGGRIIVGLGEMFELGEEAAEAHFEAGRMVAGLNPYLFVVLGDHAQEMADGAIDHGLAPERTCVVNTHQEMVAKFRESMEEGDMIFLKGSRAMHLEKVAESLRNEQSSK